MYGSFGAMPKSMNYDYIVEEFMAEVKLDKKELNKIIEEYKVAPSVYLRRKFDRYWPENTVEDISKVNIDDVPNTIFKRTFYRQSEKDENTIPINHYSLQEIILTRLQQDRNANKKLMAEAKSRHDVDGEKRFNALQLALKVISNSFYGASDNKVFAHYDSNVAGTITWAARNCIGQLTEGIECEDLYIDEAMYNDPYMQERIQRLQSIGALTTNKIEKDEYDNIRRRNGLRRLFNDVYDVKRDITIYRIHKSPGVLVYQDTDSNYFIVPKLIEHYLGDVNDAANFRASPELLRQLMLSSVDMNELLGKIIVSIIDRKPVGLGFEGSFVICRYLNRKKKYYGIKAADDDGNVFPDKLLIEVIDEDGKKHFELMPGAYNEDGTLTKEFDKLRKPKEKLVPWTTGEFVRADDHRLFDDEVNFLDYIMSYGVKVTGVDLTRRDKLGICNYYHVKVLQRDLQICRYDYETHEWIGIPLNQPITELIYSFMDEFRDCMRQFQLIADFRSDVLPNPCFSFQRFTKNARYDSHKNAVYEIVSKYNEKINKLKDDQSIDEKRKNTLITRYTNYIPYVGDRLFYVICKSDETERNISRGLKKTPANKDLAKSVQELHDTIEDECDEDSHKYFDTHVGNLSLTYEQWMNAKLISNLYMKYYLKALGRSMSLYLLGELYPDEARRINNGEIENVDDLVTKLANKIGDAVVNRYYPAAREMKSVTIKKTSIDDIKERNVVGLFHDLFPNITYDSTANQWYRTQIKRLLRETKARLKIASFLQSSLKFDRFSVPQHMDSATSKAYQKCNTFEKATELVDRYSLQMTKLTMLDSLLK